MSVKVAVYGSLRKGAYNYERFKRVFPDGIKYIKTVRTTEPFFLWDLGYYPGIKRPELIENSILKDKCIPIVVDLLEVSEEAYRIIDDMEKTAGYVTSTTKIDDEKYKIFIFNIPEGSWGSQIGHSTRVVENGDWLEYYKKNEDEKSKDLSFEEE